MGFSASGAERGLTAATGGSVSAASDVTCRLHAGATPTTGNEHSGNGYTRATLSSGDFSLATESGYRRLRFPAMEWYADATNAAPDAQSVALWHGTDLIWHRERTVQPNNQRVYANVNDIYLEVDLSDTDWVWTTDGLDRFLNAISGAAVGALTVYWELHSGTPPTSANRLTGGGIDGIEDVAWDFATASGFRRRRQGALEWSAGMTADANAAIAAIGLWSGRPESSGTLLAHRPATADMPETDDTVRMPANALYTGVNLVGTNVT